MKPKNSLCRFLAAIGCATIAASAADVTWDITPGTVGAGNGTITGGAGFWDTISTNGNWTTDGGANNVAWVNGNNDTAVFGGTAGAVTLGSNVTVGGLTFNTNNYSIAPGAGPFGITFGTPGNINVSTGTTNITAAIGGSAITKTGGGALTLSVANTFSGLKLNGGTVNVNGSTDSLGAAGSTITVLGNTTLQQGGSGAITLDKLIDVTNSGTTLTFVHGNNAWTILGAVSGAGAIKVNDSGGVFTRTLSLRSTSNSFTGKFDMTNGNSAVAVNSLVNTSGSGNIVFDDSNAGFRFGAGGDGPSSSLVMDHRRVEFTAAGGTAIIDNAAPNAFTFTIGSNLLVTGVSSGTKTLQLSGANTGNNAFNGLIANGGLDTLNLNKNDGGKWILGNVANSYVGATAISGGTLEVTKLADGLSNSSIGASSANVNNLRLLNGTTLRYTGGGDSTNRNLSLQGSATIESSGVGAALNFTQTGAVSPDVVGLSGTFALNNATVTVASTANLAVGMSVTAPGAFSGTRTISSINSDTSITLSSASSVTAGAFSVNAGTPTARTLTLRGSNTGSNTIAGVLQNSTATGTGVLSVTKNDVGTWALSGDNTYTGATTVSGGTLLINGNSSTAVGSVTVASGATIGGIGTIGGATTVNGTLSPGQSPGTLTFSGNLTINNLATYVFEGGDLTAVGGVLDLNNNWTLALGSGFQAGGSVTIFTYGSLASSPDLVPTFNVANLGFAFDAGTLTLSDTGSSIVLSGLSAVPEPSAALLGGLGALLLLRRRRA